MLPGANQASEAVNQWPCVPGAAESHAGATAHIPGLHLAAGLLAELHQGLVVLLLLLLLLLVAGQDEEQAQDTLQVAISYL